MTEEVEVASRKLLGRWRERRRSFAHPGEYCWVCHPWNDPSHQHHHHLIFRCNPDKLLRHARVMLQRHSPAEMTQLLNFKETRHSLVHSGRQGHQKSLTFSFALTDYRSTPRYCDPHDHVITCKGYNEFCKPLSHPFCKNVKSKCCLPPVGASGTLCDMFEIRPISCSCRCTCGGVIRYCVYWSSRTADTSFTAQRVPLESVF